MSAAAFATEPQYSSTIADAIGSAERALMDASMPIHILLTTKFGELNDNQEEMVGAAAGALNRIAQELAVLKALVCAAQAGPTTQRRPARIGDVLRALEPELRDLAARVGASLKLSVEPGLPHAWGDDRQLRDGIRLALIDDIRFATPGTIVEISVTATPSEILVSALTGAQRSASGTLMLAERILAAQGARLELGDGRSSIAIQRVPPG